MKFFLPKKRDPLALALALILFITSCASNIGNLRPPQKMTGQDYARLETLKQLNEQAESLYTLNDSDQALRLSLFLINDYKNETVLLTRQELFKSYEKAIQILTEQKSFSKAFSLYQDLDQSYYKSPEFDKYFYRSLINMGILFLHSGDAKKSHEILNNVIQKITVYLQKPLEESILLKAYYNRGIARIGLKKYTSALRDFNVLIRSGLYTLSPEVRLMRSMSYVNKAAILIKQKNYGGSIPLLKTAIRLSKKQFSLESQQVNVTAYYNLGIAYLKLGNKSQAYKNFSLIVKNYRQFNDAQIQKYLRLAQAYMRSTTIKKKKI